MIQLRNYFLLLFILSTSHFIFGQSDNPTHVIEHNQEDCAVKLAEKEEIIKKQRNEIEKLHQKIELLETKLGIKPKNKEPKPQIEKEPKPVIPKPILTTVTIGSQTWTNTNLNIHTFRNGDSITHAQSIEKWMELGRQKVPAWCWYENDPKSDGKIGKLYNWHAVNDPRGLAPEGYHIPDEKDWNTLIQHLGGELEAAPKMRIGTEWGDSIASQEDKSNFAAIPAGWIIAKPEGTTFSSEGAYWWCATQLSLKFAWTRYLVINSKEVKSFCFPKASGLAVRCVKD